MRDMFKKALRSDIFRGVPLSVILSVTAIAVSAGPATAEGVVDALLGRNIYGEPLKVSYGPGQLGLLREHLAGYMNRAHTLQDQLNALGIQSTYCRGGHPTLADDTKTLAALQSSYNQLMKEYNLFKAQTISDVKGDLQAYPLEEVSQIETHFWDSANNTMAGPASLLKQKTAELMNAHEIDCSKTATGGDTGDVDDNGNGSGGSKKKIEKEISWAPVAPSNPLTGLIRPAIDNVPLPMLPGRFCTEQARWDYYDNVFKPLYDRAYKSEKDASAYRSEIAHQYSGVVQQIYDLEHDSKPGTVNPNMLAELQHQSATLKAEVAAWEPITNAANALFYEFSALSATILKLPVIECTTQPKTTPPVPSGNGQTGMALPPAPLYLGYPATPGPVCGPWRAYFTQLLEGLEQSQAQTDMWVAWAGQTADPIDRGIAAVAQTYTAMLLTGYRKMLDHMDYKYEDEDCPATPKKEDILENIFGHASIGVGIGNGRRQDREGEDRPQSPGKPSTSTPQPSNSTIPAPRD